MPISEAAKSKAASRIKSNRDFREKIKTNTPKVLEILDDIGIYGALEILSLKLREFKLSLDDSFIIAQIDKWRSLSDKENVFVKSIIKELIERFADNTKFTPEEFIKVFVDKNKEMPGVIPEAFVLGMESQFKNMLDVGKSMADKNKANGVYGVFIKKPDAVLRSAGVESSYEDVTNLWPEANTKPYKNLNTAEPNPIKNESTPIWELVIQDMQERDQQGRAKYGTPLQANNGRKPLVDAYQECLDNVVYMRQEIEERKMIEIELSIWREKFEDLEIKYKELEKNENRRNAKRFI